LSLEQKHHNNVYKCTKQPCTYIDAYKFGAFSEFIEIDSPHTQTHTFPGLSIGPEPSVGGSLIKGTTEKKFYPFAVFTLKVTM